MLFMLEKPSIESHGFHLDNLLHDLLHLLLHNLWNLFQDLQIDSQNAASIVSGQQKHML
jgi:hypothetical protein